MGVECQPSDVETVMHESNDVMKKVSNIRFKQISQPRGVLGEILMRFRKDWSWEHINENKNLTVGASTARLTHDGSLQDLGVLTDNMTLAALAKIFNCNRVTVRNLC